MAERVQGTGSRAERPLGEGSEPAIEMYYFGFGSCGN
jgi:hypothetical protein